MTLDQKRELFRDDSDPEILISENPYVLRDQAKNEMRESLQSRGNYSFGGVSPFKKLAAKKSSS